MSLRGYPCTPLARTRRGRLVLLDSYLLSPVLACPMVGCGVFAIVFIAVSVASFLNVLVMPLASAIFTLGMGLVLVPIAAFLAQSRKVITFTGEVASVDFALLFMGRHRAKHLANSFGVVIHESLVTADRRVGGRIKKHEKIALLCRGDVVYMCLGPIDSGRTKSVIECLREYGVGTEESDETISLGL